MAKFLNKKMHRKCVSNQNRNGWNRNNPRSPLSNRQNMRQTQPPSSTPRQNSSSSYPCRMNMNLALSYLDLKINSSRREIIL